MRAPRQQSSLSAIKYFIFIHLHVSLRLPAIPRERGLLSDFTLLCVIFLQCQHGCTSCDTPIESCNKQFFARTCTLLTYTRSWLAPISRKNHYLEDNIKQCSSLKMLLYFHFPRRLDSRSSNQHNFLVFLPAEGQVIGWFRSKRKNNNKKVTFAFWFIVASLFALF